MRTVSMLFAAIFLFIAGGGGAVAGEKNVSMAEAKDWLKGYESAWEERNADKAASLFTENASYRDNPHKEPYQGRDGIRKYWSDVTADQRNVEFNYEVLTTYGNTAVATWSATLTSASSGSTVNLDGIFLLDFEESGLCNRLREWWHVKVDKASNQ